MPTLISIKRIVHSGWITFKRQGSVSFATVFVLVIILSLITFLFLFQQVSNFLVTYLEEKVDISVYFNEEVLEENILKTKQELIEIPEVKEIEYISKEKALLKFSERHKDDPVLMESLEELGKNPFLPYLNIRAKDISQYAAISSFLDKVEFKELISKVDYYQKKPIIEKFSSLISNIRSGGIALTILLALVVIMVVFNQIRLAIYNSRNEISIMRLVGASNWFIRGPFLIQGIISGIISSLITILLFTFLVLFFGPKIEILMPGLDISTFFFSNFFTLILIQISAATVLVTFSGVIAIRKFLKV